MSVRLAMDGERFSIDLECARAGSHLQKSENCPADDSDTCGNERSILLIDGGQQWCCLHRLE
jgi:hypothetical protein